MKKLVVLILAIFGLISLTFANTYILFYGKGCPHCKKVRKYILENNLSWNIQQKEVYFNSQNQKNFLNVAKSLKLDVNKIWVPFLYVESWSKTLYKMWDSDVIQYLSKNKDIIKSSKIDNNLKISWKTDLSKNVWQFLLVMIPAAASDSINPCAFAVILILLGSILCKYNSRKKVYLSGLMFSLSIFISYYLMWIGLYKAFASLSDTMYLKLWIWILGILVWLANLKDFFWYGKWFVMEVPFSWRPKLKKIIDSITSPVWAFVIGFLVSLFLLPCTSWPYVTILWYLASEHKTISMLGYFYLFVYNLIFILPMLLITFIVWKWYCTTEYLLSQKEKNVKVIHLIVGLLMLGLGIYVIYDSWIFL
jgi:cytochrome c biogenesis protein CcdA/glutaredoxin